MTNDDVAFSGCSHTALGEKLWSAGARTLDR